MFALSLFLSAFAFLCIDQCWAQYYFVIAPNVLRYEHDETVSVNVFGLNNARIRVWLEHSKRPFSQETVIVQNEAKPEVVTVRVKEADIFGKITEEKPRVVSLCSEYNGEQKCREIILSYQSGYLIMQTDKPIYTPLQKVKIRALALEESLRPIKDRNVSLEITDPNNTTMARITTAKSVSGFFQHEFTLPPYPELGVWTARAFYRGQFDTSARSHFQVAEYVLPTFGVTIDVDVSFIIQGTPEVNVVVRAKYVYGKPVDGTARLTLNCKHKDGTTDYILDIGQKSLQYDGGVDGSVAEFNIETRNILDSPSLKDKPFPDGSKLEVIATVYESATGNEEARSHDKTIFTLKPYQFSFTRSKTNFRPGWEYYLKMDLVYANGEPAANKDVVISRTDLMDQTVRGRTDSRGQFFASFNTPGANKLTFKASTEKGLYTSEIYEVTPYEGQNQIQVEAVSLDNSDHMTMRAFTNIRQDGYTGLLFMVLARGKVVQTNYSDPTNQGAVNLPDSVQRYLSPSARLLVFYVDKSTSELVADSVRFDLNEKCRGQELKLETGKRQILPGKNDQLTVTGTPYMWVGLNAMDKALLLLNDKNVLRKSKVFEALKSHDLGCGEGSGKSSGDVFKKSGLTVITNAKVSDQDLKRDTGSCGGNKRRRRGTDSCFGVKETCCERASEKAELLYDEAREVGEIGKIDPYTQCYAAARVLVFENKLPTACIMAYFYTCKEELEYFISGETTLISKSLDGSDEDYASDLARLAAGGVQPLTRNDFRESWLFEVHQLKGDGVYNQFIDYPHSITEWMFQAIGISEKNGVCVADPLDVRAYRDFFIQLHLPYKAARMEFVDIKATIFNYGLPVDKNKIANVYLEATEHLCFSGEPGKPSPRIQLELPPNTANTVTFPMVPMKAGQLPIRVSAMVTDAGIPDVDVIEKKLYVVNEGIEETVTIQVCLDPNQQRNDCANDGRIVSDTFSRGAVTERIMRVDLTLPINSIAGTGEATAYIQSNIFDNVVKTLMEGVESLFQLPQGCGEQTIIRLAPTVYAMGYLKQTKQMTSDIEKTGNQFIRDGVTREVSQYRHDDGAYAAWRHRPASTWLTAFVAKVFCQAKKVVDDAVDERNDIALSIEWLVKHVQPDGSFTDNMPVIHREMIGLINEKDPTLTPFVLITLLECSIQTADGERVKAQAMGYIERLSDASLLANPYLLAISTYALALAESPRKWHLKTLLERKATVDARGMRWGTGGQAQSIETTGYALLAMLEFNDLATSANIVRWMTSQRNARGVFTSTQDTVVGLQALSTYTIRTFSPDVDLQVNLLAKDWRKESFSITKENSVVQHVVRNLPVEHEDNILTVNVVGTGSATMLIDLRYNRPAKEDEVCPFHVTDVEVETTESLPMDPNLAELRKCDVCGKCEDDPDVPDYSDPPEPEPKIESNFGRKKRASGRGVRSTKAKKCIRFSVRSKSKAFHGMSIVNFGLETDVDVVKEDLEKLLEETPNIARYEMPTHGKGFIVFYLDNVTKDETKFIFRLVDNYAGNKNTRQPSVIKLYDYYHPEEQCTLIYGTGPSRADALSYTCDKKTEQCKCVQSTCAQLVDEEIKTMASTGKRPAINLMRYTCNPDKANYAVLVEIEEVDYDNDKEEMTARGIVQNSIHKGAEQLARNDEMTFFWKIRCSQVQLEAGKTYYVIGKDGHKFEGEKGRRYPVMSTTLVVEKNENERLLSAVMSSYATIMHTKGCQN